MKHTKRRTRTTRRKRTFGGVHPCLNTSQYKNKNGNFIWPNATEFPNGCKKETIENITVPKGAMFDRFGGPNGMFVGKMKDGKPETYNARAIPYIRKNANGTSCTNTYIKEQPEYHVYVALEDIPDVEECNAAPFADHTGNAVQLKFKKSIKDLIENGIIKEIPGLLPAFI